MASYSIWEKFSRKNPKRHKLFYLQDILMPRGINLDSTILELASGLVSLGYFLRGVLSADINPRIISELKRNGLHGIVADIYNLPLKDKSFDYVIAFNPPLKPMFINTDQGGVVHFHIDEAFCLLVEIMFRVARKSIFIFSDSVPSNYSDLPFKQKAVKYCPEPPRSVLYNIADEKEYSEDNK